jgi:hypothetical protein
LKCADQLDPVNVTAESEQRDFVVAAAVAPPPPPAWRRWAIIAAAGAVLIGGAIALAMVLIPGKNAKKDECKPACPKTSSCVQGQCKPIPVPPSDARPEEPDAGHPTDGGRATDACDPRTGRPCGECNGVLQCDGFCSKPTPDRFGQSCNACGGTVQCDGCLPPLPTNFGQKCNECGGVFGCNGVCSTTQPANYNQPCNRCGGRFNCQGACTPPEPPDYGQIKTNVHRLSQSSVGSVTVGGPCMRGYTFENVTTEGVDPGGSCTVQRPGSGSDCSAQVLKVPLPFAVSGCNIAIRQRRVCDPVGRTVFDRIDPRVIRRAESLRRDD